MLADAVAIIGTMVCHSLVYILQLLTEYILLPLGSCIWVCDDTIFTSCSGSDCRSFSEVDR